MLLAISLQHPQWLEISYRIVAIVSFLFATGIGFRIASLGSLRSTWVLFLTQAFLVVAISLPFVHGHQSYSLVLVTGLCLALGLQNGAITSIEGLSLHATFLSGDVTSLIELFSHNRPGNLKAKKQEPDKPVSLRVAILFSVVLSFLIGACCASLLIARLGFLAPLVLILPLGTAAVFSTISTTRAH